jgi:hypothetical protein
MVVMPMRYMGAQLRVRIGDGAPILNVPIMGLAAFAAAQPPESSPFDLVAAPGGIYVAARGEIGGPALEQLHIEVVPSG